MNLNDKQNRTESPDVPAEMAEVTAVDVVSPVRADAAEESVEEIGARTLSPGRLVMKRFFRSRLSMTDSSSCSCCSCFPLQDRL